MAVITIRLNDEEQKVLDYLTEYCHEDKSTLIKKSLLEMYEDLQDIKFIDKYVKENKQKNKKFVSSNEIEKQIKGM